MRLLLVGSTAPWAIEQYFTRYLQQMDVKLEVFDPSHHIDQSIFNRVLLRTGNLRPYHNTNAALLRTAERVKPDIVWVFKGIELLPATLMALRNKGIKLANYNPDHPFIRTFFSNGGKNVEDSVPLYDLHFCYSRDLADRIERDFNIRAAWLPFGYDMPAEIYERIRRTEEIKRIGFVGNPDRTRARIVRQLAEAGLPVDVYGHSWGRFLRERRNVRIFDAVYGDQFWEKIRQYRVQLNIFRPHNAGSHNMRTFEVPAAGGIMLAPENSEHTDFFKHGKEAFFFNNDAAIEQLSRDLLAMKDVSALRDAARLRSLEEDYSYSNRAATVNKALREMILL